MPNSSYFDPSTALPDPSVYAQHGPFGISIPSFLGNQAAANRRETIAPFLQRAGQEDALNLQKLQTDIGEYTGAEASGLRSQQRQTATVQSLQQALSAPGEGELSRGQTKQKLALLPLQNDKERADLTLAVAKAKGTPAGEALAIMGSLHGAMDAAKGDFVKQNEIRVQALKMFAEKFPGMEVPEQLLAAKPDMYHAAYSAMVHTAQHEQEMAKGEQTQTGATKRTGMEQEGATARNEATLEQGKPPAIRLMNVNRILSQMKADDPKRQGLLDEQEILNRQEIDATIDRELAKPDMTNPIMATQMGPKLLETYQTARANRKSQLMIERGVPFSMAELRRNNPGIDDTKLREEAKKRGIKIRD